MMGSPAPSSVDGIWGIAEASVPEKVSDVAPVPSRFPVDGGSPPASVLGEACEAAACFQPDQAPLALLNFREMGFFHRAWFSSGV